MKIIEYKSEPCPVCGHKQWCGRREDGLVLCKRPPSPPEVLGYVYKGLAKDGQTAMYVEEGKEYRSTGESLPVRPRLVNRPSDSPATLEAAHETAIAALTPELRSALDAELGLPENVLTELAIGWSDTARHHASGDVAGAYVFPEHNGQGRLIGDSYRFPADKVAGLTDADGKSIGNKSSPTGLRRGLTLPLSWKDMPDPILVVEGTSDVLAGRAVGLSVIGRPSNSGGVEFIAQLCRHRKVILLGENDRKTDGRWPGRQGAEAVARRLENTWDRPVPIAFPPKEIKDLREWVHRLVPDWQTLDADSVRQTILDAVEPAALLLLAQPCDRRGRVTIKVFRRNDGVEATPIHSDRLHIDDAAARRRFARSVAKVDPDADVDDLQARLLALKAPPQGAKKLAALLESANLQQVTECNDDSTRAEPPQPAGDSLPTVFLPGGPATITQSALMLGSLLAETDKYYNRGGTVVTVGRDNDGRPILETLKPAGLASVFETVAKLMEYAKEKGQFVPQEAISSEQDAKLIQHCAAFLGLLPPIYLLSRCPVLIERDGQLVQISGYDRDSGILAFGEPAPDMPLDDAVVLLSEMLADFRFATSADRARALAAVITPALVFGDLMGGRAPVDLGEADASQSGKGYRAKLTAAIYGHIVKTVTQKKGGVGSMEESFATALIQGYNFISFDNVRNAIDSPALESFLTEDTFLARSPHIAAIEVDPRRVIVQLTSNRAEITTDLANRSSCVRILKQPEGYRFRAYPEGGILEHVRANQPLYLGAVFEVAKAWHAAGKPLSDTIGHDFRPWARSTDWIVQNIFGAGPLLEGHRETQVRMATPVLNWLRGVALAVRDSGHLGILLRAADLADIIAEMGDTELPGLPEGADLADEDTRKKVLQAIGRRLSQCFRSEGIRTIDGFRIERTETDDPINRRTTREYCFEVAPATSEPLCLPDQANRRTIGAESAEMPIEGAHAPESASVATSQDPDCAYAAPIGAPIAAPNKTLCAPNAPMGSVIRQRDVQKTRVFKNRCEIYADSREVIGTHRRIGAIGAEPPPSADPDNPRQRWCKRAEALVVDIAGAAIQEDLLHLFDEREAIVSVDGGLDDDAAGQMAYEHLLMVIHQNERGPTTQNKGLQRLQQVYKLF